ncbi:MAG TPA: hypothetical protein DEO83_08545 [Lachnospiraceae bacterium]|nr:hypothetical protein [Lachnospiraceae bacterium]
MNSVNLENVLDKAKSDQLLGKGYIYISSKVENDFIETDDFVPVIKAVNEIIALPIVTDVLRPGARLEDIKKLIYAGADFIYVPDEKLFKEGRERFEEKVVDSLDAMSGYIKSLYTFNELSFSEFKTDDKGLVPCIVQDYKTNEVLMMAYMNEESYKKTLETRLMTYWTRSRQKLWTKGEESGHFQYLMEFSIDCDKDTLLAKVRQIGPACHTGNNSCFFTPIIEKKNNRKDNPLTVLEDVYKVIADRKANPREGSYTNYLFDKGIDKILKKVGEECTEIVIAAKNPDPEEIKYEIADFLYHAMVLMVERGVTWEEITDELARRE